MTNRCRNHILQERSFAILRDIFPDSWLIHSFTYDYGVDIQVEIFSEDGTGTGNRFYAQVKSTDNSKEKDSLQLDRSHFDYWAGHTDSVALFRYYEQSKQLFWCWMHDCDWRIKDNAQSLDVVNLLRQWKEFESPYEIERYLRDRRQAFLTPSMPPYKITVESNSPNSLPPIMASNIAKLINSNHITVLPKTRNIGNFHLELYGKKMAASYYGFPGIILDCERKISNEEITSLALLAVFLCACRYRQVNFAKIILHNTEEILYNTANANAKIYFFDALIFTLGIKETVNIIFPLIKKDKKSNLIWYNFMISCAYASYKYGEEREWSSILKDWIDNPPVENSSGIFLYNLGNSLSNQGQYLDACKAFASALQRDSSYEGRAYFWEEYGAASFEAGKYEDAARCYEKMITLNNDNFLHWKLGDAFFHLGEYTKAVDQFKLAIHGSEKSNQDYIILLMSVCNELSTVWGIQSQSLVNLEESEREIVELSQHFLDRSQIITYLKPTMEKNAIDGLFNFNAGVLASNNNHHSIAMYRFLVCALNQRWDSEAWTNAIMCAINANEHAIAICACRAAYFYIKEDFLPQILGLNENSPAIPDSMKGAWTALMQDLVNSLEQENERQMKGFTLRVHAKEKSHIFHL